MKLVPGLCAVAAAASFAAGCSSSQPPDKFVPKPPEAIPAATVTPGNESSLLPLDKGNQWTYSVEVLTKQNGQDQAPKTYESVWTVKESNQTKDGTSAVIETTATAGKPDEQGWLINGKGIYEVSDGSPSVFFSPPFPVVLFPVKEGSVYNWKGTGPNGTSEPGPQTSQRTIRGSEVVDTDMGQFSAIPIDDVGTLIAKGKQGKSTSTIWFAPGVGIVRLRQEVLVGNQGYVLLLKLKSKALMKS